MIFQGHAFLFAHPTTEPPFRVERNFSAASTEPYLSSNDYPFVIISITYNEYFQLWIFLIQENRRRRHLCSPENRNHSTAVTGIQSQTVTFHQVESTKGKKNNSP